MKYNFLKYKHVIWDWNGTLLNDTWISVYSINNVLSEFNHTKITIDKYREKFKFPISEFYESVGLHSGKQDHKVVADKFINCYFSKIKECKLHENVNYILNILKNVGIGCSILSSSPKEILLHSLSFFNINSFFGTVCGVDNNDGNGKLENGLRLLELLNINKRNIVLIGDTDNDYFIAKKLGIECILISNGHQERKRLEILDVSVIENITELIKQIKDIEF